MTTVVSAHSLFRTWPLRRRKRCVDQAAIPVNALGALGRMLFWFGSVPHFEVARQPIRRTRYHSSAHRRLESPPQTDSSTHALEAGPFRLPARGSRLR